MALTYAGMPGSPQESIVPSKLTLEENQAASLRAQEAAFCDLPMAAPPSDPDALELWLQNAAGLLLFKRVRAAGLATMDQDAPEVVKASVELAVDATVYALMMQIDGVSGGLTGEAGELDLTYTVKLTADDALIAEVDLRNGDGMCMGFHAWCDGDFGDNPIVGR